MTVATPISIKHINKLQETEQNYLVPFLNHATLINKNRFRFFTFENKNESILALNSHR